MRRCLQTLLARVVRTRAPSISTCGLTAHTQLCNGRQRSHCTCHVCRRLLGRLQSSGAQQDRTGPRSYGEIVEGDQGASRRQVGGMTTARGGCSCSTGLKTTILYSRKCMFKVATRRVCQPAAAVILSWSSTSWSSTSCIIVLAWWANEDTASREGAHATYVLQLKRVCMPTNFSLRTGKTESIEHGGQVSQLYIACRTSSRSSCRHFSLTVGRDDAA